MCRGRKSSPTQSCSLLLIRIMLSRQRKAAVSHNSSSSTTPSFHDSRNSLLHAMEASKRRLAVVEGHFDPMSGLGRAAPSARPELVAPAVTGLTTILDHDNLELRKRMKAFLMADDIYIPRCVSVAAAHIVQTLPTCVVRQQNSSDSKGEPTHQPSSTCFRVMLASLPPLRVFTPVCACV